MGKIFCSRKYNKEIGNHIFQFYSKVNSNISCLNLLLDTTPIPIKYAPFPEPSECTYCKYYIVL